MQDSVAMPEPVTLLGEMVQAVLLVARLTKPTKPFRGVTVIEELPVLPAFKLMLVGDAVTVKSWTV